MVSGDRSSLTVVIVATAAAIETDENQNDPVVKIRSAARRKPSVPRSAATGYPLPIALPHTL